MIGGRADTRTGYQRLHDSAREFQTTFGDRLSWLLDGFDSRAEAAAVSGVTADQLAKYVRGGAKPALETMARLCAAKSVSIDWLSSGKGSRSTMGEDGALPSGLVSVPLYDVRAGAGHGQIVDEENPIARLSFDPLWLKSHGIKPNGAQLLFATGDSMRPTIEDGDPILIDATDCEPRDKIYVIRRAGALMVKRIQRRSDGSLVLISDNPAYAPEPLPRDDADSLQVIGRVGFVFKSI